MNSSHLLSFKVMNADIEIAILFFIVMHFRDLSPHQSFRFHDFWTTTNFTVINPVFMQKSQMSIVWWCERKSQRNKTNFYSTSFARIWLLDHLCLFVPDSVQASNRHTEHVILCVRVHLSLTKRLQFCYFFVSLKVHEADSSSAPNGNVLLSVHLRGSLCLLHPVTLFRWLYMHCL